MIPKINLTNYNNQYRLKSENKNSNKPNFGGFTRLVMSTPQHPRPFHTTEEFLKIAGEFKSKTIGKLPKEFLTLFPNEPQKVFQFLDELSEFTRGLPLQSKQVSCPKKLILTISSDKKLPIKYLGEGHFGKAFVMGIDGKSFVFKSFKKSDYRPGHGAGNEIKNGLNLYGDYKDINKTYIGNFEKHKEWSIMEYISPYKSSDTRKGPKLFDVRRDIKYTDILSSNYINGIRIDFGGIEKKGETLLDTSYLETKDIEEYLKELEKSLPRRKKEFYLALNNPDPKAQKDITDKLHNLDRKDVKKAFYAILDHPNNEIKENLADNLYLLNRKDQKKAFYDLLNHPAIETKMGLDTQFDLVYFEYRKEVYDSWINYLKSQITLFEVNI